MKKTTETILRKTKIITLLAGIFSIFLLTSACHCDDDDEKIANNKVLLLKFDNKSHDFIAGKEYKYFNDTESFTLTLTTENKENEFLSNITYKEANALLLKTTSTFAPNEGRIIIPEDFSPAERFDYVLTNDFVLPQNGYNTIGESPLDEPLFMKMWAKVQNLKKIREYMHINPEQQIQIFLHQAVIENHDNENNHWIFFIKN